MNIGMILDNEFYGDLRVENEVMALTEAGFNVFILCFTFKDSKLVDKHCGAVLNKIKINKNLKDKLRFLNNTAFDFYSIIWKGKIKKFIKKNSINVLHAHDLYMAKPVINAAKGYNLKLIIDLHENYPETLISYSWANSPIGKLLISKLRWLNYEAKYLKFFDKIIVLSENFKNELTQKYPFLYNKFLIHPNYPNNSELLNYPIDVNILEKNDSFIIFYFGAVAKRRGIFTLIDALKKLVKISKEFKILIIGPIDKADKELLNRYINDFELKDNIIQYDWKNIKYFPSYASISDICVSPLIKNAQHESGIANKIFQYMLFEKPLIVSNCLPQQKVVEENNCGLVFQSENAEDLAEKIIELYNSKEMRKKMGVNGKKAVMEKYNLNISGRNLVKMYKQLMKLW